jgi:hypothetical protein
MHDPATSLYPDPASLLIGSKWVEATGHTIAAVAEADAADIGAVVSTLNSGQPAENSGQPADYASDVCRSRRCRIIRGGRYDITG